MHPGVRRRQSEPNMHELPTDDESDAAVLLAAFELGYQASKLQNFVDVNWSGAFDEQKPFLVPRHLNESYGVVLDYARHIRDNNQASEEVKSAVGRFMQRLERAWRRLGREWGGDGHERHCDCLKSMAELDPKESAEHYRKYRQSFLSHPVVKRCRRLLAKVHAAMPNRQQQVLYAGWLLARLETGLQHPDEQSLLDELTPGAPLQKALVDISKWLPEFDPPMAWDPAQPEFEVRPIVEKLKTCLSARKTKSRPPTAVGEPSRSDALRLNSDERREPAVARTAQEIRTAEDAQAGDAKEPDKPRTPDKSEGEGETDSKPKQRKSVTPARNRPTRGRPVDNATVRRAEFAKSLRDAGKTWAEIATAYSAKYKRDVDASADTIRLAFKRQYPDQK